mgnify:CR=1 FL=1
MREATVALTRGIFPFSQIVLCASDGTLPTVSALRAAAAPDAADDIVDRLARRQLLEAVQRCTHWRALNVHSARLSPLEVACLVHDGNAAYLRWRRLPRDRSQVCTLAALALPRLLCVAAGVAAVVWCGTALVANQTKYFL